MTPYVMPERVWPGDEPPKLHPAPEVVHRPAAQDEIPGGARAIEKLAARHGWRVVPTYARGTRAGRPPRVVDSIALRLRREGVRAWAVWLDGKFDTAMVLRDGELPHEVRLAAIREELQRFTVAPAAVAPAATTSGIARATFSEPNEISPGRSRVAARPASYAEFIARKVKRAESHGREVALTDVHPMLHPWQVEIVQWAVRTGRAAIWADTGLGKTVMQLEWARLSGGTVLIVAPLAVCAQTVEEAAKLGIAAQYVTDGVNLGPGIWVTNYERVHNFDPALLDAVVLDEASILKNHEGKTRTMLIEHFAGVPRRLACTATPAPNDPQELTNQAAFLGVASRVEMLAAYFIHDSDGWRLKGHGRGPMFRWLSSWAIALRKPADVGYPNEGYDLPPLDIRTHLVPIGEIEHNGELITADSLKGVSGRAAVRRLTVAQRVDRAVELVKADPAEQWLLWTGRNDEARGLAEAIPGAVNVEGTWTPESKAAALLGFAHGDISVLVTKPSIAAFGLNWQRCARMAFVGLSDSYEQYYQCIRRCWRYGQQRAVQAHVVLTDAEQAIAENVASKEAESSALVAELVAAMNERREIAA